MQLLGNACYDSFTTCCVCKSHQLWECKFCGTVVRRMFTHDQRCHVANAMSDEEFKERCAAL